MNLFAEIRKSANAVVYRHCNEMRWEANIKTAKVMKLSTPGNRFHFQVRYEAMTPGGDLKLLFVEVKQEGELMFARIPFCNSSVSFSLRPFLDKWNAPRAKSQQECIEEALLANHKATLSSKTFLVVAISQNVDSKGLRCHILKDNDGLLTHVWRSVFGTQWTPGQSIKVTCDRNGIPYWGTLECLVAT